jgi:hypothetical protein
MTQNGLLQDQLKGLKKRKEILVILIFLFVIVIFWIGLSLFSSQEKLGITPEQKKMAQPLTPNINVATLEKLEQKKKYTEFELKNFPVYSLFQNGGVLEVVDVSQGLPEDLEEVELPEVENEATSSSF